MQHRFAYVGADLQDLYGIDPRRIERATTLSDAYFSGASAADMLDQLAAHAKRRPRLGRDRAGLPASARRRDQPAADRCKGPPVSSGCLQVHRCRARISDRAEGLLPCRQRRLCGPHDRFGCVRICPDASQGRSRELCTDKPSSALAFDPSLKVTDIGQAAHLIGSSLTAVDLGGLTTIELAFQSSWPLPPPG